MELENRTRGARARPANGGLNRLSGGPIADTVLLKRSDPNNWSPGNIENEVHQLIDSAPWWKIYDVAVCLYVDVGKSDFTGTQQANYHRSRPIGRLSENSPKGDDKRA